MAKVLGAQQSSTNAWWITGKILFAFPGERFSTSKGLVADGCEATASAEKQEERR